MPLYVNVTVTHDKVPSE